MSAGPVEVLRVVISRHFVLLVVRDIKWFDNLLHLEGAILRIMRQRFLGFSKLLLIDLR